MKKTILSLIFILLTPIVFASEVNFNEGVFIMSWETNTAAPHELKDRHFSIAKPPKTSNYKQGWNYNKLARIKNGLQVYLNRHYMSVEYFKNGKIRSTASYSKGKPNGWFYNYDADRKKHGLQHYINGEYRSVTNYTHGEKVAVSTYKNNVPEGWFYIFRNKKKDDIQKYVSGNYWVIETYKNGKKNGLVGSFKGNKKDGWHYQYNAGKKTSKIYYVHGVVK